MHITARASLFVLILSASLHSATLNPLQKEDPINTQTICGTDDRELSSDPFTGRAPASNNPRWQACSAALIGPSCMLTAGHCHGEHRKLTYVEFNTPEKNFPNGMRRPSDPKDVYLIDKWFGDIDNGRGDDWAVFSLKPNKLTGLTAEKAQGGYRDIDFDLPVAGDDIQIIGYGRNLVDKERSRVQATGEGTLVKFNKKKSQLWHSADTHYGSSGSAILSKATDKVIGIHTHGGCGKKEKFNSGTAISSHSTLKAAIKACLRYTRKLSQQAAVH